MKNITERLRAAATADGWISDAETDRILIYAADEIDRLRELLREARGEIAWSPAIMGLVRRIDAAITPQVE